jgi:hypothetical protein
MTPSYNLVLADKNGTPLHSFTRVENTHMEFHLNKPCVVPNITIDGRAGVEVDSINEIATDYLVYRNEEFLFRGRIHYGQDNLGQKKHTVNFSAIDYRGLLDRRIIWNDLTYTNIDQSQIAWNLIAHSQTRPGGTLGITRGSGQSTGRLRTRPYERGQNVGTLIQQLSEVIDGFEYEVSPELEFNLFYPQRGSEKDFVLDYGGTVSNISRTVSSADFANVIGGSGDSGDPDTANPWYGLAAGNITTAPEGRWEKQIGYPDVRLQDTVQEKVEADLVRYGTIRPSYVLTLRPGYWNGKSDLWIGDSARLVIKSGRLNVNDIVRVHEVDIKLDENNEETVAITVNAPEPTLDGRFLGFETRITTLERR